MFIVRSVFWLAVAFAIIAPKGTDFSATATDLSAQAMAAGQQIIVEQVLAQECDSLQCIGGKAMIAAVLPENPSIGATMQDSPTDPVPFPRPRPDWMG